MEVTYRMEVALQQVPPGQVEPLWAARRLLLERLLRRQVLGQATLLQEQREVQLLGAVLEQVPLVERAELEEQREPLGQVLLL
jgi:hypothetical protein